MIIQSFFMLSSLAIQFQWLLLLALPVACISWTVTHEEIFREPREFCQKYSRERKALFARKFFYVFTCEYCFSHYVSLFFIIIVDFRLLVHNWLGYVIALFSLVWIANIYMSLFGMIRLGIKKERTEINIAEEQLTGKTDQ